MSIYMVSIIDIFKENGFIISEEEIHRNCYKFVKGKDIFYFICDESMTCIYNSNEQLKVYHDIFPERIQDLIDCYALP